MCVCMIYMYLYMCVCVCVLQVPRRSEHKCHVVSSLLSRTRHWIQRLTRITSPPEGGHLLWKSERSLSSQKPGHSIFCPYGEGRMLHQITSQYVTDPHPMRRAAWDSKGTLWYSRSAIQHISEYHVEYDKCVWFIFVSQSRKWEGECRNQAGGGEGREGRKWSVLAHLVFIILFLLWWNTITKSNYGRKGFL